MVRAETGAAAQLLSEAEGRLAQMLAEAGLRLTHFDASAGGQNRESGESGNKFKDNSENADAENKDEQFDDRIDESDKLGTLVNIKA